jgi:dipeptidase E
LVIAADGSLITERLSVPTELLVGQPYNIESATVSGYRPALRKRGHLDGELLLISNSTNPGGGYLDHCVDQITDHFSETRQIAFIPYALADHEAYAHTAEKRFRRLGLLLASVHREEDPRTVLSRSDGVFVGGGNTFRLLAQLRSKGLLDEIKLRVESGMSYAGASAGSNVACPTIKTTNDMPIVDPRGFEALGLFPYQINAHYVDRDPDVAHGGETRAQRIAEFHEENTTPVIGLYEGAMLRHEKGRTSLHGNRALLFRQGKAALELAPGVNFEEMISHP